MTFNAIRMTLQDIQQSIDFCISKIEELKEIEGKTPIETIDQYDQIIDYLKDYRNYLEFGRDWT